MCRFIAYLGKPIIVDELLVKPSNSLIHQNYSAEEMSQTLNGDYFLCSATKCFCGLKGKQIPSIFLHC